MSNFLLRNNKGYSLIEVLVVAGIIVLLAGIGIPYLRKYQPNLKLTATARDMVSDLRYAQQLTITEQVVHIVEFDIFNGKYQILKLSAATSTIKMVELDSEVAIQQIDGLTNNQVRFNSYGAVSESGDITLVNVNSNTAVINIKPSGYVRLE